MNGKDKAINDIVEFLKSDRRCILITGTHQYKKHVLVMALLDKYYKNAKILFRASGVNHAFSTKDILGQFNLKTKKSGELFELYNNYYAVDSYKRRDTWYKSNDNYDFAIVFSIDAILQNSVDIECIQELFERESIKKIFLISWTDHFDDNYSKLDKYLDAKTFYDVEEENIEYHNRVKEAYYRK